MKPMRAIFFVGSHWSVRYQEYFFICRLSATFFKKSKAIYDFLRPQRWPVDDNLTERASIEKFNIDWELQLDRLLARQWTYHLTTVKKGICGPYVASQHLSDLFLSYVAASMDLIIQTYLPFDLFFCWCMTFPFPDVLIYQLFFIFMALNSSFQSALDVCLSLIMSGVSSLRQCIYLTFLLWHFFACKFCIFCALWLFNIFSLFFFLIFIVESFETVLYFVKVLSLFIICNYRVIMKMIHCS